MWWVGVRRCTSVAWATGRLDRVGVTDGMSVVTMVVGSEAVTNGMIMEKMSSMGQW
jgi:deoxyxylulose-5-phosphate synthase